MPVNIILDLDNTLIHCPENVHHVPPHLFNLRKHHVFLDGELHVIFERPFLEHFLRSLRGHKIAVWTAAEESYAQFIVKHILEPYLFPDQKFEFVWHRNHCNESTSRYGVLKHVKFLNDKRRDFHVSNTIIVDDNSDLVQNGNNVYLIKQFNGDDLDDFELVKASRLLTS